MPYCNTHIYMVVLHYALAYACWDLTTDWSSCRIPSIYVVYASRERVRCEYVDDHVFQMNVCTGDMGIYDRLGQRIECTLNAYHGSICRQILFHNDHRHNHLYLINWKITINNNSPINNSFFNAYFHWYPRLFRLSCPWATLVFQEIANSYLHTILTTLDPVQYPCKPHKRSHHPIEQRSSSAPERT